MFFFVSNRTLICLEYPLAPCLPLALGRHHTLPVFPMAPIKDETVDNLRDLVQKLESRVQQLEAKLDGSAGASGQQTKGDGPSIRMILMGPPGAGKKNMPSSGY